MATTQEVQALYIGLLGRAADKEGLQFWINDIASGNRTLDDVREAFAASPEFQATYGGLSGDRDALVSTIYANLFERAPDAEGLAYWVGTSLTADELIAAFIQYASPADQTVLTNKVLVAEVYTNVAGTDGFDTADAAAIVADVNGDLSSVTTALGNVSSLPGIVAPATVSAIKALETTTAKLAAYETTKANLDALVELNAKAIALATKAGVAAPAAVADGGDAGTVTGDSWAEVSGVAVDAAGVRASVSASETNVLQANADNATSALTASKQALVTTLTNGAALVKAFETAAAANVATTGADATASAAAVADLGGLQAAQDSAWDAAIAAANVSGLTGTAVTAQNVYDFLADDATSDAAISALKSAFAASGLNALAKNAFTAAADLAAMDRADAAASQKLADAGLALSNAATAQGGTAPAALAVYNGKFGAYVTAQQTLANAKEADALKAQADALKAAHDALVAAQADAAADVAASAAQNLSGTGAATAGADVFYFGSAIVTGDDQSLTLTAGDSLYIGQGFTFNAGALSTGNGNAQEFFLVQNGANTEIVIETTKYGSSTTDVAGPTSPDAAVITLTGVTVDQLQVSNGVISYVA